MTELTPRDRATLARRRMIIETAALCFAEKGFHQTSMRDLAERAGIGLGNLYNHFKGKAELIREIARLEAEELQRFQEELAAPQPAEKTLDRFVVAYALYCAQPENAQLGAEIFSEGLRIPEIAEDFMANRRSLTTAVANLLERLDANVVRAGGLPAETRADLILDLAEGQAGRAAFEGRKFGAREKKTLQQAVRLIAGVPQT